MAQQGNSQNAVEDKREAMAKAIEAQVLHWMLEWWRTHGAEAMAQAAEQEHDEARYYGAYGVRPDTRRGARRVVRRCWGDVWGQATRECEETEKELEEGRRLRRRDEQEHAPARAWTLREQGLRPGEIAKRLEVSTMQVVAWLRDIYRQAAKCKNALEKERYLRRMAEPAAMAERMAQGGPRQGDRWDE